MWGVDRSIRCVGVTAAGGRCGRRTRSLSGWCGRCQGPAGVSVAAGATLAGSQAKEWADRAAADDPLTHAEVLGGLAGSSAWGTALKVARNPSTPAEAVVELAGSQWPDVAAEAVAREVCPVEVLVAALAHRDVRVRRAAARNPSTPAAALEGLVGVAGSGDDDVDAVVAGRADCPPAALVVLSGAGVVARMRAAEHSSTPTAVLVGLAGDSEGFVRRAVGRNPSTPTAALVGLAGDGGWQVRLGVAANPSTPTAVLVGLAADLQSEVRAAAIETAGSNGAAVAAAGLLAD